MVKTGAVFAMAELTGALWESRVIWKNLEVLGYGE
jgi:hypothetical protein